jgi:hypothetical protein
MKPNRLVFASVLLLVSSAGFATDFTIMMPPPTTAPTTGTGMTNPLYLQLAMEIGALCGPVEDAPELDLVEILPPEEVTSPIMAAPMDPVAEIYHKIDVLGRKIIYKQGYLAKIVLQKKSHESRIAGLESQRSLLQTKRDLANANGFTDLADKAQVQMNVISNKLNSYQVNLEKLEQKMFDVELEISSLFIQMDELRSEMP